MKRGVEEGPATARNGRGRVVVEAPADVRVERRDESCLPVVRSLGDAIVFIAL